MQPDPNPILAAPPQSAAALQLSPEALAFLRRHRPDLAEPITLSALLHPAIPPDVSAVPVVPSVPQPTPAPGLGDLLAALLRRLGITAAVALLQRRGWLTDCGCAARRARLNALAPRLLHLLRPRH